MEGTKILLTIPPDFDRKLNEYIAELKYRHRTTNNPDRVETKVNLIIEFAKYGFEVKTGYL